MEKREVCWIEKEVFLLPVVFMELFSIIFFVGVIFILLYMYATAKKLSNNEEQERGNRVIACFECDNVVQETTQMINFHKEKGIVHYQI